MAKEVISERRFDVMRENRQTGFCGIELRGLLEGRAQTALKNLKATQGREFRFWLRPAQ